MPPIHLPQLYQSSSTILRQRLIQTQTIRRLTTSRPLKKTTKIDMSGKNPGNVVGGHKATISDPNRSDEAKAHSKAVLEEHFGGGAGTGGRESSAASDTVSDTKTSKNLGNVVGGYKATLSNEHIGSGAKAKAKNKLNEMGVEVEDE